MKKISVAVFSLLLIIGSLTMVVLADYDAAEDESADDLKLGVEVLLDEQMDLLDGKRVGLITNPTGVDQELNHIVDVLHNDPEVELTALYGPERSEERRVGKECRGQCGRYAQN